MLPKQKHKYIKEIEELKNEIDFLEKCLDNADHRLKAHRDKIDNAQEMLSRIEKIACENISSMDEEATAQIITAARFGIHYSKNMDSFPKPPEDIENCYIAERENGRLIISDCRRWRGFPNCRYSEECPRKHNTAVCGKEPGGNAIAILVKEIHRDDLSDEIRNYLFSDLRKKLWDAEVGSTIIIEKEKEDED